MIPSNTQRMACIRAVQVLRPLLDDARLQQTLATCLRHVRGKASAEDLFEAHAKAFGVYLEYKNDIHRAQAAWLVVETARTLPDLADVLHGVAALLIDARLSGSA